MHVMRWAAALALSAVMACSPAAATAAVASTGAGQLGAKASPPAGGSSNSLEAAATKAGDSGRRIAFSLIGLAFAIAAIVMSFKRDFRDAIGVLAIGVVAVLLASPAGIGVLQDTVKMLFG